jgi:hypothetical protein
MRLKIQKVSEREDGLMTKVNIRHFQSLSQIKSRRRSQQQEKPADVPKEPAHQEAKPIEKPLPETPESVEEAKPLTHQQQVYREMAKRAEAIRHQRQQEQKKQQ